MAKTEKKSRQQRRAEADIEAIRSDPLAMRNLRRCLEIAYFSPTDAVEEEAKEKYTPEFAISCGIIGGRLEWHNMSDDEKVYGLDDFTVIEILKSLDAHGFEIVNKCPAGGDDA